MSKEKDSLDTVKSKYLEWKAMTQNPEAGRVQVLETRKEFYSGFLSCLTFVLSVCDRFNDESAEKIMTEVHNELSDFFKNEIFKG